MPGTRAGGRTSSRLTALLATGCLILSVVPAAPVRAQNAGCSEQTQPQPQPPAAQTAQPPGSWWPLADGSWQTMLSNGKVATYKPLRAGDLVLAFALADASLIDATPASVPVAGGIPAPAAGHTVSNVGTTVSPSPTPDYGRAGAPSGPQSASGPGASPTPDFGRAGAPSGPQGALGPTGNFGSGSTSAIALWSGATGVRGLGGPPGLQSGSGLGGSTSVSASYPQGWSEYFGAGTGGYGELNGQSVYVTTLQYTDSFGQTAIYLPWGDFFLATDGSVVRGAVNSDGLLVPDNMFGQPPPSAPASSSGPFSPALCAWPLSSSATGSAPTPANDPPPITPERLSRLARTLQDQINGLQVTDPQVKRALNERLDKAFATSTPDNIAPIVDFFRELMKIQRQTSEPGYIFQTDNWASQTLLNTSASMAGQLQAIDMYNDWLRVHPGDYKGAGEYASGASWRGGLMSGFLLFNPELAPYIAGGAAAVTINRYAQGQATATDVATSLLSIVGSYATGKLPALTGAESMSTAPTWVQGANILAGPNADSFAPTIPPPPDHGQNILQPDNEFEARVRGEWQGWSAEQWQAYLRNKPDALAYLAQVFLSHVALSESVVGGLPKLDTAWQRAAEATGLPPAAFEAMTGLARGQSR